MKKEFQVPSELARVQTTGHELLEMLTPLHLDKSVLFDIRLCFEEALINAMKYGNGLDRTKNADVSVEFDDSKVAIAVQDQGKGFNPGELVDCTDKEHALRGHGRGVHLICKLMDKVEYNDKGNRVLMVKFLKPEVNR